MATIVKANCPVCGDVQMSPSDVRLHVCAQDPSLSFFTFLCPSCSLLITRHASVAHVRLLSGGGVRPVMWESSPRPGGPPLSEDDLITFGLALEALDSGGADSDPRPPAPPATTSNPDSQGDR